MGDKGAIRLVIRREGRVINAYVSATEFGTVLLGSIAVGAAHNHPDLFESWKTVMKNVLSVVIKDATGIEPDEFDEFTSTKM